MDSQPHETAEGFGIVSQLLREAMSHDRKSVALIARLSERVATLDKEMERVRDAGPDLETRLRQELAQLRQEVEAAKTRASTLTGLDPLAQQESVKGKWAFYGLIVTSLTGLITGLLSLFAK